MCHKCETDDESYNSETGHCNSCCIPDIKKITPHKHAALIKAWADCPCLNLQFQPSPGCWINMYGPPDWSHNEIRIKPEPKPDVIVNTLMRFEYEWKSPRVLHSWNDDVIPVEYMHNLKLDVEHIRYVFDGETGKLKSVELIK